MKRGRDHIKEAAEARSDLNIFYGVIALLEGGTISAPSYRGSERIIKICKREAAKCLRRYDRERALAHSSARRSDA